MHVLHVGLQGVIKKGKPGQNNKVQSSLLREGGTAQAVPTLPDRTQH